MAGRRPSVAPPSSSDYTRTARFEAPPSPSSAAPARPERRRPVGATPSPATLSGGVNRFPDPSNGGGRPGVSFAPSFGGGGPSGGGLRAPQMGRGDSGSSMDTNEDAGGAGSKSRRMMDQLARSNGQDTPPLPSSRLGSTSTSALQLPRRPSHGSSASSLSSRPGSPSSDVESSPQVPPTAALTSAISAFSSAGANASRRDGRRGGLADQGYTTSAQERVKAARSALSAEEWPDTPAFREVEGALSRVRQEWPVLMAGTSGAPEAADGEEKDFDPVSLALSLLDPNSGDLSSFLSLKSSLDAAISSTLSSSTTSYRAYESSITTHNSTLQSLGTSQKQVGELKKMLTDAREKLEGKGREGLVGMHMRMSHLEEMGKILDEIDHFRLIPDRLESLLSEKRFLSAVVLLVRSLKAINKPEMMEIGALGDLRSWLVGQEGVLLEILIEELHNHLYLKSFYCDVRWKSYTRGQANLPQVDFGDDAEPSSFAPSHLEPSFHTSGRSTARLPRLTKLQRYLNWLSLKPSINPLLDEPVDDVKESTTAAEDGMYESGGSFSAGSGSADLESVAAAAAAEATTQKARAKNPELDSFAYLEQLVESVAVLGKLGYGLDAVAQRVQGEMFSLVEATVEEVEERNDTTRLSTPPSSLPSSGRPASSYLTTSATPLLKLSATETEALESNTETLKDLFWTLYSKLDAVLQGFRVAYEVAGRVAERRDFKDAGMVKSSSGNLLFSLLDVWKPVQQEVRALLHDYLTDDQSGTVSSRNPIVSVNEVLRLARPRDATKQIFKFVDSDLKASSKALKAHEEALHRALKIAVPGLMTDTSATAASSLAVNSTTGGRGSGLGGTHKALVQADAFNVSVLFGPTLAFLERVKEIMPGGMMGEENDPMGFGGFLDEFVLRTFLPQLEEKVSTVFHQAVGGLDAFQEDPNYKKVSRVPIVKSVSNLMLLISSLCAMLRATPFHRDNYSHLIVSVIHQFFQRCHERFKDLTARDPTETAAGEKSSPLKTSATWAEAPDLNACLLELRGISPDDHSAMREALKRETKIELDKKRNGLITPDDLITPSKKLLALGTLYSSLDWFILHVSSLKTVGEGLPAQNGSAAFATEAAGTPESSPNPEASEDEEEGPGAKFSLPLTSEMTRPFEALLKSYRTLANLVLFTLRLEIRLRTIHYLDKATRDGVYQLAEDIAEPDPSVVDLNSNLAECDECAATTLAEPERRFIFEGLSLLMDQLLISNSRHIRLANKHGLSKMMRNILALQQNLKNIGDSPLEVDFDRSRKFWTVFGGGPKDMLDAIRNGSISYDFEDYKSLLNLMCGIDQSSKDAATASANGDRASTVPLSGGTDRSRRMYNEYLIDLFALDVGDADDN